jgi:hypothetical protein
MAAAAVTLAAQTAPTPAETLLDWSVLKALDEELSGVAIQGSRVASDAVPSRSTFARSPSTSTCWRAPARSGSRRTRRDDFPYGCWLLRLTAV